MAKKEAETHENDEEVSKRQEVVESTSYFLSVKEKGFNQRGSERDQSNFTPSWQELTRIHNID